MKQRCMPFLLNLNFHIILLKRLRQMLKKFSGEITEKDIKERRDFRNIPTFTIDPADAKDFDDALSLKQLENGNWEVGVHIADVTHYVKIGFTGRRGSKTKSYINISCRQGCANAS